MRQNYTGKLVKKVACLCLSRRRCFSTLWDRECWKLAITFQHSLIFHVSTSCMRANYVFFILYTFLKRLESLKTTHGISPGH